MRDVHMSWPAHDVVPDRGFLDFSRASSLLSELKAFSASISNIASGSGFSISSSSCGLPLVSRYRPLVDVSAHYLRGSLPC